MSKKSNSPRKKPKRYLEAPRWNDQFTPFGDRLNFLSEEGQHAVTGKLKILPPKDPRRPAA